MGFFRNLFGMKNRVKKAETSKNTPIENSSKGTTKEGPSTETKEDPIIDNLMKSFEEFQKKQLKEEQQRLETAANQGMLPPPNIRVHYDCKCGSKNSFGMGDLNLNGGLNIQCSKCGAVLHVPPTILEHKEYWDAGGGASLVPNWRDQMKFIN
jgi:hypothetical protein